MEKVSPGAKDRGVDGKVYNYCIKARLESGRIVSLFWPSWHHGEELLAHSGKYVNGVLKIMGNNVFPIEECSGAKINPRRYVEGTIKTGLDPSKFFDDPSTSRFKIDREMFDDMKTWGIDTVDGMFLCTIKPDRRGDFKEGDKVCVHGRIDLLGWSPIEKGS